MVLQFIVYIAFIPYLYLTLPYLYLYIFIAKTFESYIELIYFQGPIALTIQVKYYKENRDDIKTITEKHIFSHNEFGIAQFFNP